MRAHRIQSNKTETTSGRDRKLFGQWIYVLISIVLRRRWQTLTAFLLAGVFLKPVQAQLPTAIGWTPLPANTSLQGSGACPPNNFEGDPFLFSELCQNVIRTWNGAIADTTENRLIIWGGGHVNYYGNEIYSLNLTVNPITLTRVKDPTVPTNYANSQNCIESIPPGTNGFAPNSREDYGGLAFIPSADVMYILNGSLACGNGYGSLATWTIPLNNLSNSTSWVYENPSMTGPQPGVFSMLGGSSYGNIAVYDPNSDLVFVSDSSALFTYNYHTNTYTRITAVEGFVTSIYLSGAIDTMRKLFIAVGGCFGGTCGPGEGVFVADIGNPTTTMQDWTAATMADHNCAQFLSGGSNPISAANPGIAYDSVDNDFVGWPNQGNSVYIMTPDTANHRLTCQVLWDLWAIPILSCIRRLRAGQRLEHPSLHPAVAQRNGLHGVSHADSVLGESGWQRQLHRDGQCPRFVHWRGRFVGQRPAIRSHGFILSHFNQHVGHFDVDGHDPCGQFGEQFDSDDQRYQRVAYADCECNA
jgi:hypothetical protein